MATELRLFRIVDGHRRQVIITIDNSRLILDEKMEDLTATLSPLNINNSRELDMAHRGIKFHHGENGQLIIDSVAPQEQEAISFFGERPCWFPGCEELRALFKAEKEAAGGSECSGCDEGAIIRKFLPVVRESIKNGTAGAQQVP